MSKLRTTIEISTGGLDDYSVPVEITYSVRRGCQATYMQPGESDTASLESIVVIEADGKRHSADWLIGILESDEEILSLCLVDEEDAREYAADQKADADREERFLAARQEPRP